MLDPGGNVVLMWNRVFLVSCVASHFIDPLFFFLPIVERRDRQLCMTMDHHLAIILTCLRSFLDIFFIAHIAISFSTAHVDPSSKVLGRGELVTDPKKIANRYIRTNFFIDLVAALPVPQVCLFHLKVGNSTAVIRKRCDIFCAGKLFLSMCRFLFG